MDTGALNGIFKDAEVYGSTSFNDDLINDYDTDPIKTLLIRTPDSQCFKVLREKAVRMTDASLTVGR